MIGEMPGVAGVHVLAHSRGGGLTMDALSALGNEYQLRGEELFSALPLRNVVLLSPDIDTDIAAQRLGVGLSDPDLVPDWSVRRPANADAAPGFRLPAHNLRFTERPRAAALSHPVPRLSPRRPRGCR